MKPGRGSQYYGSSISFIDMLFNIIMLFVLLFFAAIMLINPDAKKKDIEAKADMIITMTWPDNSPHDMDLWVLPPDRSVIGYTHMGNSFMFLERDDLGWSNNFTMMEGHRVELPTRREVITFRGKENGRYVVNVHFFMSKDVRTGKAGESPAQPVPVKVELVQINPKYKILASKELPMANAKEEKTAFSFTIRDGEITDIDLETDQKIIADNQVSGESWR